MNNKHFENILVEMLKGNDVLSLNDSYGLSKVKMQDFTRYLDTIGVDYIANELLMKVSIPYHGNRKIGSVWFTSNPRFKIGFRGVIL